MELEGEGEEEEDVQNRGMSVKDETSVENSDRFIKLKRMENVWRSSNLNGIFYILQPTYDMDSLLYSPEQSTECSE